jgi:hypothetical protein
VGIKKAGGYIFKARKADHPPYHVHIYYGKKPIGRWDIENQKPMDDFEMSRDLRKALYAAGYLLEKP